MRPEVNDVTIDEQLSKLIESIHPEWREEFVRYLTNKEPSPEFLVYFDHDPRCQWLFEQAFRLVDFDLEKDMREAFKQDCQSIFSAN